MRKNADRIFEAYSVGQQTLYLPAPAQIPRTPIDSIDNEIKINSNSRF